MVPLGRTCRSAWVQPVTAWLREAQGMENAMTRLLHCCQTSTSPWLWFPTDTKWQERLECVTLDKSFNLAEFLQDFSKD